MASALLLALVACSGDDEGQAGGAGDGAGSTELTTVSVGSASPSPQHVAFWLAKAEGYFEEEGIEVKIVETQGGPAVLQALLGGDLDVGLFSPSTALQVEGTDKTLTVVAGLSDRALTETLIRADFLADKGIDPDTFLELSLAERLEALRGARWTITNPGDLIDSRVRVVAREAGFDADRDFEIRATGAGSAAAQIQLLRDGDTDAGFYSLPENLQLKEDGVAVPLLDPDVNDEFRFLSHSLQSQVIVESGWAQDNDDVVRRFVAAVARANREVHERPPADLADAIHREFPEVPVEHIETTIDALLPYLPADSRIPAEVIETNIELALIQGVITEPPDVDDVYTEDYLPQEPGT